MNRHHLHLTLNEERFLAMKSLAALYGYRSITRFLNHIAGVLTLMGTEDRMQDEIREMFDRFSQTESENVSYKKKLIKRL